MIQWIGLYPVKSYFAEVIQFSALKDLTGTSNLYFEYPFIVCELAKLKSKSLPLVWSTNYESFAYNSSI